MSPSIPASTQSIGLPTISVNLSCLAFHIWAEDFLAAERLYAPTARRGSFVAHFLCCQSIELSLKAYLSLKGQTRDKLKRNPYGHNLVKLFADARVAGVESLVTLLPEDAATVQHANEWYDTPGGKRFQYLSVIDAMMAFKHAPDLEPLESLAARLQSPALRETLLQDS
jgi:hypothetical protein